MTNMSRKWWEGGVEEELEALLSLDGDQKHAKRMEQLRKSLNFQSRLLNEL